MARGILYLMETAVPGLVKIGKTGEDNFERRMYELERNGYANVTGLQRRYAIAVDAFDEKEQLLHDVFGKSRLEGTEFFAVDVEMVASLMASLAGEQVWKEALGFPGTPSDDGLREIIRAVCSLKGWEKSIYVGGINGYENGNGFFNPKANPAPEPVKSESEKTASDPYVKAIAGYLAMKVPAGWDKMSTSERIAYKKRYEAGDAEGDCDIVKTTTAQLWCEALGKVGTPSRKDAIRIGKILCELMKWKKTKNINIEGYSRTRGFTR